jgi:hypothetical protein
VRGVGERLLEQTRAIHAQVVLHQVQRLHSVGEHGTLSSTQPS